MDLSDIEKRITTLAKNFSPNKGPSVGTLLVLGAIVSGGLFAASLIRHANKNRGVARRVDSLRDKTLKDSFPASDPPASQFFDIPVNRQ
jgi:hypothetical protein